MQYAKTHILSWEKKKQHQCIDGFYVILQKQLRCFGFVKIFGYIFGHEYHSPPTLLFEKKIQW